MKDVVSDRSMVAYCGLYCGSCRAWRKGRCPGCQKNEKAAWCKVRTCCQENQYASCGDCKTYTDLRACKKHNNFISRVVGWVLNSDRRKCVERIREVGIDAYAVEMAEAELQTLPRKNK